MRSRFAWPAASLMMAGAVVGLAIYVAGWGRHAGTSVVPEASSQAGSGPSRGSWRLSDQRSTRLFVQTVPPGALVLLDGRPLGTSDDLFGVRPGRQVLRVDLPGYPSRERFVGIPAGRVTRVQVDLTRPPEDHQRWRRLVPSAQRDWFRLPTPQLPDPASLLSHLRLPWNVAPEAEEPPPMAVLVGHVGDVSGVRFSADGRFVVSSGTDGTVRLWDVASGRLEHVLAGRGDRVGPASTAVSPDGTIVATCPGTTVYLLRTDTGNVARIPVDVGQVRCLAFAPDGDRLVCGGGSHRRAPGRLALLDPHSATVLTWFQTQGGPVQSAAFSPDGRLLAYAHGDTVRVIAVAGIRGARPG